MDIKGITTLKEYKESYHILLENHLQKYIDYDELHFIKNQLKIYHFYFNVVNLRGINEDDRESLLFLNQIIERNSKSLESDHNAANLAFPIKYYFTKDYIKPKIDFEQIDNYEKLSVSFRKIIEFLTNLQIEKTNLTEIVNKSHEQISTLNWSGTKLELSELIKALIQSNKLNTGMHQNEIFKRFRDFLNVEEFDENDKLRDISERTKTTAVFINKLEISLNNWIKAKD